MVTMTNRKLAAALRLCGGKRAIDLCPKCPFFEGYDPDVCIPKMTATCANALENHETHVLALQKEIEKLRGQLEVERRPQWVSVSERLPEKTGDYIVHTRWAETSTVLTYYGKRKNGEQLWCDADGNYYNVTHWMPLPEAPKEDA